MINHKISLYVFLAKYFNQQLSSFGFYWFGGCKYRGLSSSSSLKEETEDSQNLVRACGGRNISELHLKQRCFLHYVMQSWNLFDFNCCHFYFHLLWNQFREIDFTFVIVVIYFQWKSNSRKIFVKLISRKKFKISYFVPLWICSESLRRVLEVVVVYKTVNC